MKNVTRFPRKIVRAVVQKDGVTIAYEAVGISGRTMGITMPAKEGTSDQELYMRALAWAKEHPEAQFETPEGIAATNRKVYDHMVAIGAIKRGEPICVSDGKGDSYPYRGD